MPSREKRKIISRLLKESNICYWCGCKVVKYPLKKYERIPDNYATIEHIYGKNNPKRIDIPQERRLFLSCNKCNSSRSKSQNNQYLEKHGATQ